MKGFLEGFLFRPQGKPMVYPYTLSAKISQFPYRMAFHETWYVRYMLISVVTIAAVYWKIDQKLTSPENKAFWKEKRKRDAEHHREHMEKIWEVRT